MVLSGDLVQAETFLREGHTVKCIKKYDEVVTVFKNLNDFETASYFYNRCLEVSSEAKYIAGEARAYTGLGTCEEKVLNIF